MKRKRNPRINIEVTQEKKEKIKAFAKKHNRTVSNIMRYLILMEMRKGGGVK